MLVLWVPTGEIGEFYIKGASAGKVSRCSGCSNVNFLVDKQGLVMSVTKLQG